VNQKVSGFSIRIRIHLAAFGIGICAFHLIAVAASERTPWNKGAFRGIRCSPISRNIHRWNSGDRLYKGQPQMERSTKDMPNVDVEGRVSVGRV